MSDLRHPWHTSRNVYGGLEAVLLPECNEARGSSGATCQCGGNPASDRRRKGGAIAQVLARLVRRGVRRQVNLVRAYLSAAFQHGAKSDQDPIRLAREGPIFEVALNPVGKVPRKVEFENVADRHLSANELRRFRHVPSHSQIDATRFPIGRNCIPRPRLTACGAVALQNRLGAPRQADA